MTTTQKTIIESILAAYPVCQYAFLTPQDLEFPRRVRTICETECPRYNTTWACPPAVGSVEECRERCFSYADVLLVTTLAEVEDTGLLEETLKTREAHEEVMRGLIRDLKKEGIEGFALSTESCDICPTCAYPDAPCRFPDKMIPCVESYGILVTAAAEKAGIDFFYDSRTVTWFGMLFYNRIR
ncbi:MAG: DUF2284 domain-containing protein [Candidatus Limivivens sp.]|nr:DUF2284 domain-containing protein [Candidatus Limivivens sp.]